jgi:hypothetical protein
MKADPTFGVATEIGRNLKAKVDAALAAALGIRLGLGRPAAEADLRGIRHRLVSVETSEQRWSYLDLEPVLGHTFPKATWGKASWSGDGSTLSRQMTLEARSLPLEQAPPFQVVRAAGLPMACEFRETLHRVPRPEELGLHADWHIPVSPDRYDLDVPAHQVSEDEDLDERGF